MTIHVEMITYYFILVIIWCTC